MEIPAVMPTAARQYLARYYTRLDRLKEDLARTRLSDHLPRNIAEQGAIALRAAADIAQWLPGDLLSPALIPVAALVGDGAVSYAVRFDAVQDENTPGTADEEDLRLSQIWFRHILTRTLAGMREAPLSLSSSLGAFWLSAAAYACRGILDGCRLALRFPLSEHLVALLGELHDDTRRAETAFSRLLMAETVSPPLRRE